MITTLIAVIIGVLSLLSAVVCMKCEESYDGRTEHICKAAETTEVEDGKDWFETVQSSLSGLIALDWAKDGTIIPEVRRIWRMTLGDACKQWDVPEWVKKDTETKAGKTAWADRLCLIIEQAEGNDVFVHQVSLVKTIAEVLQVMKAAKHIGMEKSGSVLFLTPVQFIFTLEKSGGRQYYQATFEL